MSFCLHSAIRRVSICIAVVAALMLPSAAYADDSGLLKVDLSSSAQSCVIGEEIELCAAVTNEGGADAYDVSYELALPESLVTDSGPGALDSIAPGETKELKFTARAVGSEVVGAVVDELDGSGGSPTTGDSLIPVVAVLAAVLILAIFGVAAARNRGRHSALLGCLVLAIAVGTAVPVAAFADSVSRIAEGSTDIVVNGQNGTACLTVAYLTSGSQGDSGSDDSGSDSDADEPAEGIVLKPGVVEVQPEHWFVLSPDGKTAIVDAEAAKLLEDGCVAVFYPGNDNNEGMSMRVSSLSQYGEGNAYQVSGSEVQLDDVVESINISGTSAKVVGCEFSDDIVVSSGDEGDIATASVTRGVSVADAIEFEDLKMTLAEGASLTLKPSIDYSLIYKSGDLKECSLVANSEAMLLFEWSDKKDFEQKIFTATFATSVPGVTVQADFYLVAHASGEVTMEATYTGSAGFEYKDECISPVAESELSYKASFEADLKGGLKPAAALEFVGFGLADASCELGVGVTGELRQRSESFVCADMTAYTYIDVNVGNGDTLLGGAMDLLKVEKEYHPVTKKNSPKFNIHVENGESVKECTWSEDDKESGSGDKGDIEVMPGDTGYPELLDNGYGETPKLENMTGWTSYFNKLVEPFNVCAGKSVSIGGPDYSAVAIGYECAEGTVFKLSKKSWSGEVIYEETLANVYFGSPWFDDCVWTIEVLCGRVTVTNITAWTVPPVTLGECETIPYPLNLSVSKLTIPVGGSYSLEATTDFPAATQDLDKLGLEWSSSDPTVATVDEHGMVKALASGTTEVMVEAGLCSRTCEVTVRE